MSDMTEKQIQDLMIEFLQYQPRTFIWRQNSGAMFKEYTDKNNETHRHGWRASSVAGVSDILGVWNGIAIAIEVKKPGNKPTDNQREFLDHFAKAGGLAICACTLDGLKKTLQTVRETSDPFRGLMVLEVP